MKLLLDSIPIVNAKFLLLCAGVTCDSIWQARNEVLLVHRSPNVVALIRRVSCLYREHCIA